MGMARLNVWVSDRDDPCAISDRTWFITIYDCDGRVLTWCRRRYLVMPARCGHLEVEVPPGCYRISAVWGFGPTERGLWGNHFTDSAIVQARCDETVCVRLFNPSIHRCGLIFLRAVQDLVKQKDIPGRVAKGVQAAVEELVALAPRPAKGFELDHLDEIDELVRKHKEDDPEAAKEEDC